MTTIRVMARDRFTSIYQPTLNDRRLSFKARGVLAWLLDKPDDWETTAERIEQQGTEGREAIRSALKELERYDYLTRRSWRDENNRWRSEWTVSEFGDNQQPPHTGSRQREAVDGNPSLLPKTKPTTKTKSYPQKSNQSDNVTRMKNQHPGCGKCENGWVETPEGMTDCECRGVA